LFRPTFDHPLRANSVEKLDGKSDVIREGVRNDFEATVLLLVTEPKFPI
jgi:hypothetical protein